MGIMSTIRSLVSRKQLPQSPEAATESPRFALRKSHKLARCGSTVSDTLNRDCIDLEVAPSLPLIGFVEQPLKDGVWQRSGEPVAERFISFNSSPRDPLAAQLAKDLSRIQYVVDGEAFVYDRSSEVDVLQQFYNLLEAKGVPREYYERLSVANQGILADFFVPGSSCICQALAKQLACPPYEVALMQPKSISIDFTQRDDGKWQFTAVSDQIGVGLMSQIMERDNPEDAAGLGVVDAWLTVDFDKIGGSLTEGLYVAPSNISFSVYPNNPR